MISVLFTDTHFGVKNNSINWLKSQLDFIYKQLIPHLKQLKKKDEVRLVHLGDVFDSRSTISTMVATEVRKAFESLRKEVDDFIIIAGNHDYYSPNSDEVNSIDLLLGGLEIILVTKHINETKEGIIYIRWYKYGEDIGDRMLKIENAFVHADIVTQPIPYKSVTVFSGHMHIPHIDGRCMNLGSCYALNFADSNQERGYYVFDGNITKFFPNKASIRFWRLYDEEILDPKYPMNIGDYIELYISQENMSDERYIDRLNSMVSTYKNIWVIPQTSETLIEGLEKVDGFDIKDITLSMIPNELKDKFGEVLNRVE